MTRPRIALFCVLGCLGCRGTYHFDPRPRAQAAERELPSREAEAAHALGVLLEACQERNTWEGRFEGLEQRLHPRLPAGCRVGVVLSPDAEGPSPGEGPADGDRPWHGIYVSCPTTGDGGRPLYRPGDFRLSSHGESSWRDLGRQLRETLARWNGEGVRIEHRLHLVGHVDEMRFRHERCGEIADITGEGVNCDDHERLNRLLSRLRAVEVARALTDSRLDLRDYYRLPQYVWALQQVEIVAADTAFLRDLLGGSECSDPSNCMSARRIAVVVTVRGEPPRVRRECSEDLLTCYERCHHEQAVHLGEISGPPATERVGQLTREGVTCWQGHGSAVLCPSPNEAAARAIRRAIVQP